MGRIEKTIEIEAPVDECYRLWAGFESFPSFMKNVQQIQQTDSPNVWHWIVNGPLGQTVEWDARVDRMEPNTLISWHSVADSEVENEGEVRFESIGDNCTLIQVSMLYNTPAGKAGELVADIFQNPEHMVEEDLKRFRQLVLNQLPTEGSFHGKPAF